jgi:hypothetical protein
MTAMLGRCHLWGIDSEIRCHANACSPSRIYLHDASLILALTAITAARDDLGSCRLPRVSPVLQFWISDQNEQPQVEARQVCCFRRSVLTAGILKPMPVPLGGGQTFSRILPYPCSRKRDPRSFLKDSAVHEKGVRSMQRARSFA